MIEEQILFYLGWFILLISPISLSLTIYNLIRVCKEIPKPDRTTAILFECFWLVMIVANVTHAYITLHGIHTR